MFHICEQKKVNLFFKKSPFPALQKAVVVVLYMADIVTEN